MARRARGRPFGREEEEEGFVGLSQTLARLASIERPCYGLRSEEEEGA